MKNKYIIKGNKEDFEYEEIYAENITQALVIYAEEIEYNIYQGYSNEDIQKIDSLTISIEKAENDNENIVYKTMQCVGIEIENMNSKKFNSMCKIEFTNVNQILDCYASLTKKQIEDNYSQYFKGDGNL